MAVRTPTRPLTVFDRLEELHALELSPREAEVLQLIADGLGNREIGSALRVSEETVKTHVQRLLRKLEASTRAHAVAEGFRRGIVT